MSAALVLLMSQSVVVIVADDMGWGDLALHGGDRVETPNLDGFFRESRQLRTFMVSPVCSPTRAGFLTGRHSLRLGAGPNTGGELDPGETTIAEFFKGLGYATGVFGKWHNGGDPDAPEFRAAYARVFGNREFHPGLGANAHGFDRSVVYYGGGPDKFSRAAYAGKLVSWWHDTTYRPDEKGYLADLITRHAVEFIRKAKRPYFAYVPFDQVHHPLQAKPELLARVPERIKDEGQRLHSAMLLSLDENVGKVLDAIEDKENTIVLFFSDNGGLPEGRSLPFRGGKHSTLEGGVHVPAAIRWPAGGLAGGTYEGMIGHLDVLPTLAGLLGKELKTARPLDGVDCSTVIRDGGPTPVKDYYWAWRDHDVVRTDRWKLTRYVDRVELYAIKEDLVESNEISSAHPDVVEALEKRLAYWRREVKVASPNVPIPTTAEPAPAGQVLQITVSQTEPVHPKDMLQVQLASRPLRVDIGDALEFDVRVVDGDTLEGGFYVSPIFNGKPPVFRGKSGVDQFGRLQPRGPAPKGGRGVWEHRIVGFGHEAPNNRSLYGILFGGRKAGTYKVQIDNLRIRRKDGTTLKVWEDGRDTRTKKARLGRAFKDLSVRTVTLP